MERVSPHPNQLNYMLKLVTKLISYDIAAQPALIVVKKGKVGSLSRQHFVRDVLGIMGIDAVVLTEEQREMEVEALSSSYAREHDLSFAQLIFGQCEDNEDLNNLAYIIGQKRNFQDDKAIREVTGIMDAYDLAGHAQWWARYLTLNQYDGQMLPVNLMEIEEGGGFQDIKFKKYIIRNSLNVLNLIYLTEQGVIDNDLLSEEIPLITTLQLNQQGGETSPLTLYIPPTARPYFPGTLLRETLIDALFQDSLLQGEVDWESNINNAMRSTRTLAVWLILHTEINVIENGEIKEIIEKEYEILNQFGLLPTNTNEVQIQFEDYQEGRVDILESILGADTLEQYLGGESGEYDPEEAFSGFLTFYYKNTH